MTRFAAAGLLLGGCADGESDPAGDTTTQTPTTEATTSAGGSEVGSGSAATTDPPTGSADDGSEGGGPTSTSAEGESSSTGPAKSFECTLVIGYSQVDEWFNAGFEDQVADDAWELLWNPGGAVGNWANASYVGWNNPIESPCPSNADAPDRILLSITGGLGSDEGGWATTINGAVEFIQTKYPSAQEVWLQPVVGGPGHEACFTPSGEMVRASWQHAHIDAAIDMVVGGDVVAGVSPEVETCDDYRDQLGHLSNAAAVAVASSLADFYAM